TEQGLGTCWIGWFNSKALLKHLGLTRGYRAVALIALGYPAEELAPRTPRRKRLESIAFFNTPPKE
ncbi:MAG: nitroreductase family protein, partial [candidate division WOR-3 bacterium]